jgi:monoamine oxidase
MAGGADHDVVIAGAGTTGIAAARALKGAGLRPLLLEARQRMGGRAHTAVFDGQPIDLGAHWLHAARANPLVGLARGLGLDVSRAIYRFRALKDGRKLGIISSYGLDQAWEKSENRIFDMAAIAARNGQDLSIAEAVGTVGPWTDAALFMHGAYDCGAEPETISALDFVSVEDDRDMLVSGGLGALITRLGEGLEVAFGAVVTRMAEAGTGCVVHCADGRSFNAKAAILTLPVPVLKAGCLALPEAAHPLLAAASRFHAATYEHAVLRAPDAPWSSRHDEIVLSMAGREHVALFAHMEGSALHYLDLVASQGRALTGLDEAARRAHVEALLTRHFGNISDSQVLAVTGWLDDPFARGAWALARIGEASARAALRQPFGPINYAGEASSATQWGTVGGAWMEGERAAREVTERLGGV